MRGKAARPAQLRQSSRQADKDARNCRAGSVGEFAPEFSYTGARAGRPTHVLHYTSFFCLLYRRDPLFGTPMTSSP